MTDSRNAPDRDQKLLTAGNGASLIGGEAGSAPAAWSYAPSGPDWPRVFTALRRFRWWIALAAIVGTAGGYAAGQYVRPEYSVESRLWLDWSRRQRAGPNPIQSEELLQSYNWVDLVKSYAVLEHAVRELRLYVQPADPDARPLFENFAVREEFDAGEYELRVDRTGRSLTLRRDDEVIERVAAGEPLGRTAGFGWAPPPAELNPGRRIRFTLVGLRDAARELGESLQLQMLENGHFLRLELRGTDPTASAAALNRIAEQTVRLARELKGARAEELERLLGVQLAAARTDLDAAESELQLFLQGSDPLAAADGSESGEGAQEDPLARAYLNVRIERDQLRRDLDAVTRVLARDPAEGIPVVLLEAIPAVRGAQEIAAALKELTEARAEQRALARGYTEEHPALRRTTQLIETLERSTLPELLRRLEDQLEQRLAVLEDQLGGTAAELQRIPERAREESRLRRNVALSSELFTTLRSRYDEARLAAASTVPDVRILDPAQVPEVPVEDQRRRVLLLGFLGAVFLAIAGALLADRFDPRLRYPQQVSHDMGVPILGLVPRLKRRRGRFAQEEQYQGVEALRSIRLSVANAFGTAGPLALTISSPQPGDGKSFIALNLALSYAEMGRRTLLVDGDTRCGKLHRTLELERKPGLTEFLAGQAGAEDVIRRGASGTPDLIPCGTRRSDAPELLTRRRMRELLALARSEYEVIIVDSPPLGVGADPLILTGFTGHLLLVLRAGATNRIGASAQLEPVRASPVRLLGAVLNDVPAAASYGYYAYRYVPGYEARDEEDEEGTERRTRLLPT